MKHTTGIDTFACLNFLDVLHARASSQPEQRAFSFLSHSGDVAEGDFLTFATLQRRARALGARLQELGLEGARAILLYPPGLEFITAFFGCLSAGVVAVPTQLPRINRPMDRLRAIVEDARPEVILTPSAQHAERGRWIAQVPALDSIRWLASDVDAINDDLAGRWHDPGVGRDTLAFLQYTSGSTAAPKGVMITHGNLLHNSSMIARRFGSSPEGRGVFWLPLFHDMGLIGGVLQTIYCGGASTLMSPVAFLQDPLGWLEVISRTGATISGGPNFAYDLCVRKLDDVRRARLDLSRWAVAFNGAEPIRPETLDRFAEAFAPCGFRREAFLPCYGLAEATLMVAGRREQTSAVFLSVNIEAIEQDRVQPATAGDPGARTFAGSGQGVPGQELVIVDPATGRRRPADRVGEIWVAGPSVARGYWNQPEATAATFENVLPDSEAGPFLRTGDLGFLHDDELFVTGRLKDLLIIRGRNVYPQDIEASVARSHPLLRPEAGAAFSVEVEGEERLVIAHEVERQVRESQAEPIFQAIRQAVSEELDLDTAAVLLLKESSLPRTSSGKVRRRDCRARFLAGDLDLVASSVRFPREAALPDVESSAAPPPVDTGEREAGAIEAWLINRLARELEVDPAAIDPGRPMAALALGSLRAIGLVGELQEWLGRPLSPTLLYQDQSLSRLAAGLAELLKDPAPDPSELPALASDGAPAVGLPVSSGQRSLWFLHQLDPQGAAYNIAGAARVRSALDTDALGRCFQILSDRHGALRTTFAAIDGTPVLRVHDAAEVMVDFRAEDASDWRESEVSDRLAEEARRPFDLGRGPLFRARLFSRSERDQLLLLSMHHIVSDFWSVAVLLEELGRLYPVIRAGDEPDLAPLPFQATDFARWQAERLDGPDGVRLWEFWRERLAGPLPVLDLPTDRPRPAVQTHRGASRSITLDRALTHRLIALGGAHGASLYVSLLAAFQVLLHRYTGQDDVIVGSPVAGRNHVGLAGVVGYFVNTLPMRGDLGGNPSFAVHLDRTRGTVLDALEHQEFPFALMVERLALVRDPARSPVFQVLFTFQKAQVLDRQGLTPFALRQAGARMDLGGLHLESMGLDMASAQFDLSLVAAEREDGLALSLTYNVNLFERATIDRFLGHFRSLLDACAATPDRPIDALPILPVDERRRLLTAWSGGATRAERPRADRIAQLFEAQVEYDPEAIALVFAGTELTYAELNARANRLAHHLQGLGIGPEARVGLCVARSVEMIVGILGILKAGGAYVPLDPDYPTTRLAFLLADAKIDLLLTQDHLRGRFVDPACRVVCLDAAAAEIGRQGEENPDACGGGDDLAYVIYTSGSTGTPKGVMVTQRNLVQSTHARTLFYHEPLSGFLLLSSFAFDSSVAGIFGTLCRGGTLILPPPDAQYAPVALARLIADRQVSHLLCVPTLYELLLTEAPRDRLDPLRVVIVAGETCRPALVERHRAALPHAALVNEYGPTEATVWSSAYRCRSIEGRTSVPIGRPIAGSRLYVLDAQFEPVPVGVAGELYVGGPGVARGYLDRPGPTAERFVPDPFGDEPGGRLYRTGDRARWRPDGDLEFLGRSDDQVKVRGHRIEPGEVESALTRHPAVRAAVVMAREDTPGDVRLVAYLIAEGDPESIPDRHEWRSWLRERLPEPMIPSAYVAVDRFPLSPNGKVDRKALPAPAEVVDEPEEGYVAPRDPVEKRLARIAAGVLGRDRVGIHDNFFELGVDSILGIQIASRARQAGLHLTPGQIFQHPTIAALAALAAPSAASLAEQGPVSGPLPLTPIQRWFFAQDLAEPHHFNQALMLEVPPSTDPDRLERVLGLLIAHHDALRLRFRRNEAGWSQVNAAEEAAIPLSRFDLSTVAEPELRANIERHAGDLQRGLGLENGPLLRAGWFDLGADRPGRLLLVIHHLAIDGVSWRILLEDLLTLDQQLARGDPPSLPPKTTSFRQWAGALHEFANSPALAKEAAFWLDEDRPAPAPLPIDLGTSGDPGIVGTSAIVSAVLDGEETTQLIQDVPGAYGTQINDALLAALALTIGEWSGGESLAVDLEGHGREEIRGGLDLSRTLGWFTTLCPLALRIGPARDPGAVLRSVKEQLRRVPRHGIGHGLLRWVRVDAELSARLAARPSPEIRFNYLGQLDSTLTGADGYAPAAELVGPMHSPINRRGHLLEIDACVLGGRLRLDWTYNSQVHRRETIDRLADRFLDALRALIAHCLTPGVRGFTPSDFPLAGIDQATLDRLVANEPPFEDVYPLSPVQEGMLFHGLFDPTAGAYIQQFTCILNGSLDIPAFGRAWEWVIGRHTALRTAFPQVGLDRSLQVVYRQGPLPIVEDDWRGVAPDEQAERFHAYLAADRARGFDPSRAPLMRLALFRIADESYQLAWSAHHALMDGWCLPLLLREVLVGYEAFRTDKVPELPPNRPYRDFIAWFLDHEDAGAETYWRRLLAGFRAPTPLGIDRPASAGSVGADHYAEQLRRLPAPTTAALQARARSHQLTLNTLLQGAWAILLGRYSGQPDVVFGATVSGRPAELPGIESFIGLFINTLPVRVLVAEEAPLESWLKDLQDQQVAQRAFEATPLTEVQGWSEVPWGRSLFESILIFENYPTDATLSAQAGRLGVGVEGVRVLERTNFPLALTVLPGAELLLRAGYDTRRFNAAAIDRLLGHLQTLLEAMGAGLDRRLADLPILTTAEQEQLLHQWNETCIEDAGGDLPGLGLDGSEIEVDRLSHAELDRLIGSLLNGR